MTKTKKVALLFLFSTYGQGVFNYDPSRIYPHLLSIIPILFLIYRNRILTNVSIVIFILGFIFNYTIFHNSYVFSILDNPEIYIEKDSLLVVDENGFARFEALDKKGVKAQEKITFIKKDTTLLINGIGSSNLSPSSNGLYYKTGEYNLIQNNPELGSTYLFMKNVIVLPYAIVGMIYVTLYLSVRVAFGFG